MAGTELAVAYVSLVVDTKKIPGQVKTALSGIEAQADNTGKGMGSKLASGLGSTLKFGGAAIGAAAGLVIGTALNKGFERVVAIDDAKGKLAGLGHSVEGIATIMDSALSSVKGTAFGLGDAAGIAASAVAAGIKPGEELTKYLALTGDAATIAGSSLGEMGSIFNKVTTSGSAYTDNLNQLADRGIPIFQWLQEEYGVSAEALKKMTKEGKVDSETFRKVIEKNIGGAALESGKTLRGSYENMKAALGRVGAGAIEPFIPMLKAGMGALMNWADKVAPHVKKGAQFIATGLTEMGAAFKSSGKSIEGPASNFEKFGSKARVVTDGLQGILSILKNGEFKGSGMTFGLDENSKVVQTLFRIREGALALWEAIKDPSAEKFSAFMDSFSSGNAGSGMGAVESGAKSLGGVLQQVGKAAAAGALAIASLGGDTATVAVTAIKMLGGVMSFFADHTGLATVALGGLAAGFAIAQVAQTGFHLARVANAIMMPAQIASQMLLTKALIAHTAALWANTGAQAPNMALTLRARVAELTRAAATRISTAATVSATSSLGAYAAAQRAAALTSTPMVAGMRNTAAGVATMAGRMQGVGAAAISGMRSGISRLGAALGPGGLFSVGLIAGAILIGSFVSASNSLNRKMEESAGVAAKHAKSMTEYRSSLSEAFGDSNGLVDSGVKSAVAGQLKAVEDEFDASAKRMPSKMEGITAFFKESFSFGQGDQIGDALGLKKTGEKAKEAQAALSELDISQRELTDGVTGSKAEWESLRASILKTGVGGSALVTKYSEVRQEFLNSQLTAGKFKTALTDINDGAVSAAQGVDGLTGAMSRFRADSLTAEDAQQAVNDALRGFSTAAAEAGGAIDPISGKIDTTTAAGSQLYGAMKTVASAFDEAGSAAYQAAIDQGQSQADAASAAEAAGQRVRDEFINQQVAAGMTRETAIALADQYKLFPPEITTAIKLNGAKEVTEQLSYIQTLVSNLLNPVNVPAPQPTVNVPSGGSGIGGPSLNFPQPRAAGGPIFGAGGPTSDSIPTLLSADEHVWTADEVSSIGGHGAMYRLRAMAKAGGLRFAEGGAVNGIQAAVSAGKSKNGNKYVWGGTGPDGFDCSGFVGWLQQIVMGVTGSLKRLYTTYDLMGSNGFASLLPGLGPTGTQFQVGVSQEHMAATIGGQPAESGGSHGDSRIGSPAVGASDAQFPQKFHLPNSLVAGNVGVGSYGGTKRKKVEWDDSNELDLQSANVSVTQAEEDLAVAQQKFNEGKKTQADLDQARLKVSKAQQRVVELQQKKDDAAAGVNDGPAPQAPALSKAFTDQEMERLNAQISVDDANERRNEVYADIEATENDRLKADMDLSKAESDLQAKLSGKDGKSKESGSSGDYSLKGILKTFGTRVLDAGMGALEAQDPFGITSSRWWTTDFTKTGSNGETDAQKSAWSKDEIDGQLPVTPGAPGWLEGILKAGNTKGSLDKNDPAVLNALAGRDFGSDDPMIAALMKLRKPKVFDQGGWLQPGEMGINLSSRPEPIFNSPDQLRQFAGTLAPSAGGGPAVNDFSMHFGDVSTADFAEFKAFMQLESRKRSRSFQRR